MLLPDAMYYNLYFMTTKGVQIKFSELTRPIASAEDFKTVIGVTKEKGTCIEGAQSPPSCMTIWRTAPVITMSSRW